MRRFETPDINTPAYWDAQWAAREEVDFQHTLRQDTYLALIGGKTVTPRRVVELGCGFSPFCVLAARKGWLTRGIDYSPVVVARLSGLYPQLSWIQADCRHTPLPADVYDAVVAGEVIEHLENPQDLLDEMERLCAPRGVMVLSTPRLEFTDPEHLWEFDEEFFTSRDWVAGTRTSEKFPGRSYIFAWKVKP